MNDRYRSLGLPAELLVVHIGLAVTALRRIDGAWLVMAATSFAFVVGSFIWGKVQGSATSSAVVEVT